MTTKFLAKAVILRCTEKRYLLISLGYLKTLILKILNVRADTEH